MPCYRLHKDSKQQNLMACANPFFNGPGIYIAFLKAFAFLQRHPKDLQSFCFTMIPLLKGSKAFCQRTSRLFKGWQGKQSPATSLLKATHEPTKPGALMPAGVLARDNLFSKILCLSQGLSPFPAATLSTMVRSSFFQRFCR